MTRTNRKIGWTSLALIAASSCVLSVSAEVPSQKQVRPQAFRHPVIIEFKGNIDWQLSKYFRSRLQRARNAGADLLVIEIDSPGGLKNESLNIAEALRDVDWAYTVAFVPREAISGAALITLGCDELIVSPTARIGDIGVIEFDPQLFAFRFAPAKIQSVLVRQARDLASSKERSPELAESMIDKDVMTYRRITPQGVEYRNVRVDAADKPGDPWVLVPESGPERFLTVSGQRAVELGLASGFAGNRTELAADFGLQPTDFHVYRQTVTDRVVYWLNHPIGTALLIAIGLVALYFEMSAPGLGVGGLLAGLCAALFFWSRMLGGTSGWLEVVLFAAGLIFVLMELLVIPGWGLPGLVGIILMVASIFLASQDFVMPRTTRQWSQLLTTAAVLACSAIGFTIVAVFITRKLGKIPILKQALLPPGGVAADDVQVGSVDPKTGKPVSPPHPDISVGDWGHAESLLRPAGRAWFAGRSFDVISDGAFIEPGAQVKVIDIQGNRIMVAAVDEATDS